MAAFCFTADFSKYYNVLLKAAKNNKKTRKYSYIFLIGHFEQCKKRKH